MIVIDVFSLDCRKVAANRILLCKPTMALNLNPPAVCNERSRWIVVIVNSRLETNTFQFLFWKANGECNISQIID